MEQFQHMEEFIRGAEHGVILFSLGSFATTMDLSIENRRIFRNVFAKIPQRVIWKFGEYIDGISDNVLISGWIPQENILAQENTVLFISHVGKSSSLEAIHFGKPVLAVPLFTDQFSNAGNIKDLGIGNIIEINKLTEVSLLSNINNILQNKCYADKARKLSQIFNDRPMSSKEAVVYWTEYILKLNETNHIQTAAVNKPFYHYLLFDVVLFIVITFVLIVISISYVLKKVNDFILYHIDHRK